MIRNPKLPPKKGYVEVEIDGNRTYRNVETGVLIDDEVQNEPNTEVRLTALEEALTQTSEKVHIATGSYVGTGAYGESYPNSDKATELSALIAEAKQIIRNKYPD